MTVVLTGCIPGEYFNRKEDFYVSKMDRRAADPFAGSGMGVWLAWGYKKRLSTLENLRRMIYCLKGEIVYSHAPLEEAFERIGKREKGVLGELFTQTAEKIGCHNGETFSKIWEQTIEEMEKNGKSLFLEKEDREKLLSLGGQLGYLDTQMQERTLLLYLEQLELSVSRLRGEIREKCRLSTVLGVMGSLFLVIVML